MGPRTESRVTSWDVHPFEGGIDGLRALADEDFSGAVLAGPTKLFMLNGRIIGVLDGDLEAFESASATAYLAPDPSLPLLFTMLERGGETKAKYYTEDTAIEEAHETLSSGSFTGYLELSENVLSGDYYVLYQAGRSMSVAFLGESARLVTGDEAFERAGDEVGIYHVTAVDLEVVDLPEPANGDDVAGSGDAAADEEAMASEEAGEDVADDGEDQVDDSTVDEADEEPGEVDGEGSARDDGAVGSVATTPEDSDGEAEPRTTVPITDAEGGSTGAESGSDVGTSSDDGESSGPPTTGSAAEATESASADVVGDTEAQPTGRNEPTAGGSQSAGGAASSDPPPDLTGATAASAGSTDDERTDAFEAERAWRETKDIPSLDPELADQGEAGSSDGRTNTDGATETPRSAGHGNESASRGRPAAGDGKPAPAGHVGESEVDAPAETTEAGSSDARDLKATLREREEELERVRASLESAEAERDELESDLTSLREEVADLREQVERLREERDRLAHKLGGDAEEVRTMDREQALTGTNLFVRYRSKGEPTLETARDAEASSEDVNENLRLEHHTGFEEEGVLVEGESFESFLEATIEYRFVEWVVRTLLFEIRSTGHTSGLRRLYDAIPEIDRAELHGTVSLQYTENGEEFREQQPFDVILRDRMGHPLLVVHVNDSREAADEDTMATLVKAGLKTKESDDHLVGAFLVTASFFGPGALETADEATSSGFLRGGSSESFVTVSRKRGFHLCLVESRDGDFHIAVPEL